MYKNNLKTICILIVIILSAGLRSISIADNGYYTRRTAILIGVKTYFDNNNFSELPNTYSELDIMKKFLVNSLSFHEGDIIVIDDLAEDVTEGRISDKFNTIADNNISTDGDNLFFLYFTGHGGSDVENNKYILLDKADFQSIGKNHSAHLGVDFFNNQVGKLKEKLSDPSKLKSIFFFDACYQGTKGPSTIKVARDWTAIANSVVTSSKSDKATASTKSFTEAFVNKATEKISTHQVKNEPIFLKDIIDKKDYKDFEPTIEGNIDLLNTNAPYIKIDFEKVKDKLKPLSTTIQINDSLLDFNEIVYLPFQTKVKIKIYAETVDNRYCFPKNEKIIKILKRGSYEYWKVDPDDYFIEGAKLRIKFTPLSYVPDVANIDNLTLVSQSGNYLTYSDFYRDMNTPNHFIFNNIPAGSYIECFMVAHGRKIEPYVPMGKALELNLGTEESIEMWAEPYEGTLKCKLIFPSNDLGLNKTAARVIKNLITRQEIRDTILVENTVLNNAFPCGEYEMIVSYESSIITDAEEKADNIKTLAEKFVLKWCEQEDLIIDFSDFQFFSEEKLEPERVLAGGSMELSFRRNKVTSDNIPEVTIGGRKGSFLRKSLHDSILLYQFNNLNLSPGSYKIFVNKQPLNKTLEVYTEIKDEWTQYGGGVIDRFNENNVLTVWDDRKLDVKELWRNENISGNSVIPLDPSSILVAGKNRIYKLERETGLISETFEDFQLFDRITGVITSYFEDELNIIINTDNGFVYSLDSSLNLIWSVDVNKSLNSPGIVWNARILFMSKTGEIITVRRDNGFKYIDYKLSDNRFNCSPVISGYYFIVGDENGILYKVQLNESLEDLPELIKKYQTKGNAVRKPPIISNKYLCFADSKGNLFSLNLDSFSEYQSNGWSTLNVCESFCSILNISNDMIYMGSDTKSFYPVLVINPNKEDKQMEIRLPQGCKATPVIINSTKMVVEGDDGIMRIYNTRYEAEAIHTINLLGPPCCNGFFGRFGVFYSLGENGLLAVKMFENIDKAVNGN